MNWHTYFMTMVYLVAMKSKDKSTHIGAIIVGEDNEIRSTGYNSFPRQINDNKEERYERPEKYYWMEHAERNAIYNAARVGIPLNKCIMYTNGLPCPDCARAIINSGIEVVFYHKQWMEIEQSHNKWEEACKRSKEMFNEADVEYCMLDIELKSIYILKDGCRYEMGEEEVEKGIRN